MEAGIMIITWISYPTYRELKICKEDLLNIYVYELRSGRSQTSILTYETLSFANRGAKPVCRHSASTKICFWCRGPIPLYRYYLL